jgi:hypothetical protein
MALQTIKGGLVIPPVPGFAGSGNPTLASFLLDASSEKFAMIFPVPRTGTLNKFEFRLGTVTQAPGNGLKCSFQDISASNGDPDGAIDQYRVVTTGLSSNTWVTPGLITSDGTDTGTKRSVTRGDLLAAVIEFESFTAGDSLNISALDLVATGSGLYELRPYCDHFTASWSKQWKGAVIALQYSDLSYEFLATPWYPISALNAQSYANNSTPDERGLYFRFPFPVKLGGCWLRCIAGAGDADVVLYDSDGSTALATVSIDKDQVGFTNGRSIFVRFPSDVQLSANTNYRLTFKPTSAVAVSLYDFEVVDASYMDAVEGGSSWYYTERTDAGSWTETTTKRPWIGLLVTACDDGAGGGGGTTLFIPVE